MDTATYDADRGTLGVTSFPNARNLDLAIPGMGSLTADCDGRTLTARLYAADDTLLAGIGPAALPCELVLNADERPYGYFLAAALNAAARQA